jgi:hypothetical protein
VCFGCAVGHSLQYAGFWWGWVVCVCLLLWEVPIHNILFVFVWFVGFWNLLVGEFWWLVVLVVTSRWVRFECFVFSLCVVVESSL